MRRSTRTSSCENSEFGSGVIRLRRALSIGSVAVLVLAACGGPVEDAAAPTPAPPTPMYGTWGVDVTHMDPTIRPGDDFFDYCLGSWLSTAEIAPDQRFTGVELEMRERTVAELREIVERDPSEAGDDAEITTKIHDFYLSYMDEATLDEVGTKPLRDELRMVDSAMDKEGLVPALAALDRANAVTPFPMNVEAHPFEPQRYLVGMYQGALSSGARGFYLTQLGTEAEPTSARLAMTAHIETLLSLAGYSDVTRQAQRIIDLETRLAEIHVDTDDLDDLTRTANVMPRAKAERLAAGAPLGALFDAHGLPAEFEVQLYYPDVIVNTARLFASVPLETWKSYFRFAFLDVYAPYLSAAFAEEDFDYYQRQVSGIQQPPPRWYRAVRFVSDALGEAVGRAYVERTFSPDTRRQVTDILESFRAVFESRIDASTMFARSTRERAKRKLSDMTFKVGHPDRWETYDSVVVSPGDLVGNIRNINDFYWIDMIDAFDEPPDREIWHYLPHEINAENDRVFNAITFPAAVLQAPNFDPAADPAARYGWLAGGAFLGHEMAHGFDELGRHFDEFGAQLDWWTDADVARYERESAKLVEQFDGYEVVPGYYVDGHQTLVENVADLVGLQIAYDAYRASLGGEEAPVIDGFTGDQRFFIAYAAASRALVRDGRMRELLDIDTHSPDRFRVNGVVRNMDAWYDAFDVKEGDELYLAPDERVRIW